MSVLRERVTWVWLALVVLTCVTTWGLSKDLFSPAVAVVGTFLIAAVKVRYVVLDFMELRNAPLSQNTLTAVQSSYDLNKALFDAGASNFAKIIEPRTK